MVTLRTFSSTDGLVPSQCVSSWALGPGYAWRDAPVGTCCGLLVQNPCLKLPVLSLKCSLLEFWESNPICCCLCLFLQVWISRNSSKLWNNVKRMHQTWTSGKNHFVVRTVLWFLQICWNVNIWHSFRCICHIQGNVKTNLLCPCELHTAVLWWEGIKCILYVLVWFRFLQKS